MEGFALPQGDCFSLVVGLELGRSQGLVPHGLGSVWDAHIAYHANKYQRQTLLPFTLHGVILATHDRVHALHVLERTS